MNYEEAFVRATVIRDTLMSGKDINVLANPDNIEFITMCAEALEKQIPVVPIYSDYDDNGAGELIPCTATCPVCGYEFEFGDWNEWENPYCKCGQKVDWGEY